MPTVKFFNRYPSFPTNVPTVDLPCLSHNKLRQNDDGESVALFQACRTTGFFLLDLQGSTDGEAMLECTEQVFDLSREILELDQEELLKYPFRPPTNLCGYVSPEQIIETPRSLCYLDTNPLDK